MNIIAVMLYEEQPKLKFCCLGLLVIVAHEQNTEGLRFKVPLVPLIPALSIFCNVELMVHLQTLTWVRFIVWMALGKSNTEHQQK
jgi:cationic amino acid transporter 4